MKYENFSARDFIEDTYFRSWVKFPSVDSDRFWKKWIETHPHQNLTINIAKEVLLFFEQPLHEAIAHKEITISKKEITDSLHKVKRELGIL